MNTDDLIRAMSADTTETPTPDRLLPLVLVGSVLLFGLIFLASMGVRPDLAEALTLLPVLIKQTFPWVLSAAAFGLVLRLSRPGAPLGVWPYVIVAVAGVVALSVVVELFRLPVDAWGMAMAGKSAATCLVSIPIIAAPGAALSIRVLRRGAPTHPGWAGFATGLMAAGASAAVYAFYCNEDSPLFFGVWYVLAILAVSGITALAGSRFLRW